MTATPIVPAAAPSDEEIIAVLEPLARAAGLSTRAQDGDHVSVPVPLGFLRAASDLLSRLPREPAPAAQECPAGWRQDPATIFQEAEEHLCECGTAGSGEGHADWCPWQCSSWKRWGDAVSVAPVAEPVAVVINNNQPGWTNIIETQPHVTLDVGTPLYLAAAPAAEGVPGGLDFENKRLRRALEPFAEAADRVDDGESPENRIVIGAAITIGELRAARTTLSQEGAKSSWPWTCAARRQNTGPNDPAECDWPVCGCDPHADKVIDVLHESGLLTAAPVHQAAPDPAKAVGEITAECQAQWREAAEVLWDSATNAVCQALQEKKMCNCPSGECFAAKTRLSEGHFHYLCQAFFAVSAAEPAPGMPGLDWELSDKTKQAIRDIDDCIRRSAAQAGTMFVGAAEPAPEQPSKDAGEEDHRPKCRRCGLPVQQPTSRYMEPVAYMADGSVMHAHCFTGDPLHGVTAPGTGRLSPEPAAAASRKYPLSYVGVTPQGRPAAPTPKQCSCYDEEWEMPTAFHGVFCRKCGRIMDRPAPASERYIQAGGTVREPGEISAPAPEKMVERITDAELAVLRASRKFNRPESFGERIIGFCVPEYFAGLSEGLFILDRLLASAALAAATPLSAQNGVDRATVEKCIEQLKAWALFSSNTYEINVLEGTAVNALRALVETERKS